MSIKDTLTSEINDAINNSGINFNEVYPSVVVDKLIKPALLKIVSKLSTYIDEEISNARNEFTTTMGGLRNDYDAFVSSTQNELGSIKESSSNTVSDMTSTIESLNGELGDIKAKNRELSETVQKLKEKVNV